MPHRHIHIDDECLPSVTEILSSKPKPWLNRWKEKWGIRAEQKTWAANQIGTAFHAAVDDIIHGMPVSPKTRRLCKMLNEISRWLEDHDIEPEVSEYHVWSKKHKYQGTLDLIGVLNGELVIIDWKTSSGIYDEMGDQLTAYARAYEERTGLRIKRGLIVHVSKKKPKHVLSVKWFDLTPQRFKRFLKLRRQIAPKSCTERDVINISTNGKL